MLVRGWCFATDGTALAGVRARVGRQVVAGVYGWQRLDVRAALKGPPSADHCGFGLALRLRPGEHPVELEVDVAGTGWTPFASGRVRVSWLPGPYRSLTAADRREFISLERQQRGELPLRVAAHHPPHPVALERFPPARANASEPRRFCIVTPSFQQAAFLPAAIHSVLDQPGVATRYAVMDGGSTDGTDAVLERFAPRLAHWRSAPDAGQAGAVADGFAQLQPADDEIMAYLNSDDAYMPGALAHVADVFAAHPTADVVFGHRVLIDDAGAEIGRWPAPRSAVRDLSWFDLIPQETLFWRRRIWDRVGGLDPKFAFALDWDLLLRFRAAGARFLRLPYYLALFRVHAGQKSQSRLWSDGVPEMDRLRRRELGAAPDPQAYWRRMMAAQRDSHRLLQRQKRGSRC